jgi:GNAT superfamily N-acetyltransferase
MDFKMDVKLEVYDSKSVPEEYISEFMRLSLPQGMMKITAIPAIKERIHKDLFIICAIVDDKMAGWAFSGHDFMFCNEEVNLGIYVDLNFRNRGIGKQIMQKVCDIKKKRLKVGPYNNKTLCFFKNTCPIGTKAYYFENIHEIKRIVNHRGQCYIS